MWQRFLSDLRDLWTLITKGHPEVDALLPWRIAADIAKHQPTPVDWHKWEAGQYSVNRLAFWFDPDRYAGTAYDWPHDHKVKAISAYRDHMVVTRGRVDDPRFDVQEAVMSYGTFRMRADPPGSVGNSVSQHMANMAYYEASALPPFSSLQMANYQPDGLLIKWNYGVIVRP